MPEQYSRQTNTKHPSPAIVAQAAVQPLARWILLGLCLTYVTIGFVLREPWREEDMANFGYMLELVRYHGDWLNPQILGLAPQLNGLLPIWLGALALEWNPGLPPDEVVRLPFMLLLALALGATWYAAYSFARLPQAQPLTFALGGEASTEDYARTIADSAVLALLATFGFFQFSHETTVSVAQLAFGILLLCAFALSHWRVGVALLLALLAALGLGLSGVPILTLLFLGLGLVWSARSTHPRVWVVGLLAVAIFTVWVSNQLHLWQYRIVSLADLPSEIESLVRLLIWFTWPSALLALWALWRWRKHIMASSHLVLPLAFILLVLCMSLATYAGSRALFLALPPLAILAAFALPTLTRGASAFIDWLSVSLLSVLVLTGWLFWISMHLGIPAWPMRTLERLGPGFVAQFSSTALMVAFIGNVLWIVLVWWRATRLRQPLWKSLILPAGGVTLVLVMLGSIGLPVMDYARSQKPLALQVQRYIPNAACVQVRSLRRSEMTTLRFYGDYVLEQASSDSPCPWLVQGREVSKEWERQPQSQMWDLLGFARRPTKRNKPTHDLLIYQRKP